MLRFSTLLCAAALMLGACGDDTNAEDTGSTTASETTTTSGESGETGADGCAADFVEKPNANAVDVMTDFGAACEVDGDCTAIMGGGAKCQQDVLGVFELPGGFCTKSCTLPDANTTFVDDAEDCMAGGGVSCVGAAGIFTACARPCTEDSECFREGYGCIRMPVISGPTDQTFCLMNEDECCLDPDMCNTPP